MKNIIFILDALKDINLSKYITNEIFKNFNKLTILPPFSFEPDASYLSGHTPEETDSGTHFWYDPKISVFKKYRKILNMLPDNPLVVKKTLKKLVLKFIEPKVGKKTIGLVPFNFLPYFDFSEKDNIFDGKKKYKYNTIFNKLENCKQKYFYLGVPNTNGKLEYIQENLKEDILINNEIIFIYISDLDSVGHKFGGMSEEYQQKMTEVFSYIKSIHNFCESKNKRTKILIFGDHGMSDVKRYYNIEKLLKKLPAKLHKDYIYFLDSTLARFWFFNDRAKHVIIDAIPNCDYGSWITEDEKKNYYINYSHNKFGDAIWWASEGTLILPNFWQGKNPSKGMHGYRDNAFDNHTMILGDFPMMYPGIDTIKMTDVYNILLNYLELN